MTPKQVLQMIKEKGVRMVDIKFIDLLGTWQHFAAPVSEFTDESPFDEGLGFDGSSIRGWQSIESSDMLVIPDPDTAVLDPFTKEPTLSLTCNIQDPITRAAYTRDPRNVARKAEAYLKSTGIGDLAYFGPEPEFFIFNGIRYDSNQHSSYYYIDSDEGSWNSGKEGPNLGYKPRYKEGYFPVPPNDTLQDVRSEMVLEMERVGIRVEKQHHEVATAGQAEIDIRFAPLKVMSDSMQYYKYIIRNVAKRHNKTATFMPKPLFADNGSGMHTHISLWKAGKPLFAGNGYAGLSETALFFIGGILKHASALTCFTNPTTNSYKRLVPGFEAPVNLAYSARNRSAAVRIPTYSASPKAKRLEFRTPDASANPYLAFSAMLLAGLDGVQNRIDPGDPLDKNLYELPPEELAQVASVPDSLRGAIEALQADHSFLLRGDVFNEDFIANWIDMKQKEYDALRLRPHPYEFAMYYDV